MKKLYDKSELTFTLVWIGIYVVLGSLANPISDAIGIHSSAHAIVNVVMAVVLLSFVLKNGLAERYGLRRPVYPARTFLFYFPLIVLATVNLWFGAVMNLPPAGLACYLISMCAVGILEELIFRGLLFRAMAENNLTAAVIVSSITFGLGHIVNLFNGRGEDLFSALATVITAIAIGFLFVMVFHRGGSLLPCIICHSLVDMTSAFANAAAFTPTVEIAIRAGEIVMIAVYLLIITKTTPKPVAPATPPALAASDGAE